MSLAFPEHGLLVAEVAQLLSRVRLNAAQAAQLCGVSTRQLHYWRRRGLLPCEADGHCGLAALEKTILIKQTLAKGFTLQRAVRMVEERLAVESAERAARAGLPLDTLRAMVNERLAEILAQVRQLRARLLASNTCPAGPTAEGGEFPVDAAALSFALRLNRAVDALAQALDEIEQIKPPTN